MGNQAQNLKKLYVDKNIKHILTHNDSKMGEYDIFRFLDNSKLLYLKKTMNPDEYEQYTSDWEQFQKYIFEKHENICQFMFFEVNEQNQDNFDMIFEFGNYINTQLQQEQLIWRFIDDILKGLLFLQVQGLHYPLLRKRYSVYVTKTNNFKLLNPYCFPDFVKDAISIYFNPEVQIHKKKQHSENCLNRNVKEFGIMLLALIANIEELIIYQSPIEIKNILNFIKKKYSVKLYDFLSYCIHTRQIMNFYDLKNYLNQYQQRQINQENKQQQIYSTQSPKVKASIEEKNQTIKKVLGSKDNNFNDTFGQFHPTGKNNQQNQIQKQQNSQSQTNLSQQQKQNQDNQQQKNYQSQQQNQQQIKQVSQQQEQKQTTQKNHNKKVKRVVVKWMKEQMCHKEFIEYEDGTLEEKEPDKKVVDKVTQQYYKKNNVNMPTQELQEKINQQKQQLQQEQQQQDQYRQQLQKQNFQNQQGQQQVNIQQQQVQSQSQPEPYDYQQQVQVLDDEGKYLIPRNDVSDYDINKFKQFPKKKLDYWISLLTGDLGDKPKKILTSKIIIFQGCYDELKNIVNFDLRQKPSMYHQVQEVYSSKHFRSSHTVHH